MDVPPNHHHRKVLAERKGDDPGAPLRGEAALGDPRPGLVQRREDPVRRLGPDLAHNQDRVAFLDPPKTGRDQLFRLLRFRTPGLPSSSEPDAAGLYHSGKRLQMRTEI